MIKALQRLMAVAGVAEVNAAKRKLLADIQRSASMMQKSVAKGDGSGKGYQAKLQALKLAVSECTTVAEVQKIRDQLNATQATRRK